MLVVVTEDGIIGWQDRTTAVTEDCIDAFIGQNLDHHVGAAHTCPGQRMDRRFRCAHLVVHNG